MGRFAIFYSCRIKSTLPSCMMKSTRLPSWSIPLLPGGPGVPPPNPGNDKPLPTLSPAETESPVGMLNPGFVVRPLDIYTGPFELWSITAETDPVLVVVRATRAYFGANRKLLCLVAVAATTFVSELSTHVIAAASTGLIGS